MRRKHKNSQNTNNQTKDNKKITINGSSLTELRDNLKSQTKGISIDSDSAKLNINDLSNNMVRTSTTLDNKIDLEVC